jgi:4-amino-4-deoxy-L-arabinose transferase-like glycosyltransferase
MLPFLERVQRLREKTWFWLALSLGFAFLVMLFDFAFLGLYQDKNDTEGYVDTILHFDGRTPAMEGERLTLFYIRLLKPLYGIICSIFVPLLTPYNALLLLNMAFYFGTIVLLFFLLKRIFKFRSGLAALGTVWFACSYPVLKYGFSLMTDMSGYFFIVLVVTLGFKALESKKLLWFLLCGVCAGIGSLAKETSALGLLFVVGAVLLQWKDFGWKKAIGICALISATFLIIFVPVQVFIMKYVNFNYLDFWEFAQYEENFRSLKYLIGIQGASFHVLWIFACYGLYTWYKEKQPRSWLALWLVGLPSALWTIYLVRYFFVQYIAVIPFGLLGLLYLEKTFLAKRGRFARYALMWAPPVLNMLLFLPVKGGSYWSLLSK